MVEVARRHKDRLHALASRLTRDDTLAEDIVQETFLRVLSGRAPVREVGSLAAWLTRVVTHLSLDAHRRRRARRRRELTHVLSRPDSDPSPGARLESEETAGWVRRAFDALEPDVRAALWLHLIEQRALREVAACLETSRSTAYRKVREGVLDLQAMALRAGLTPS